MRTVVLIIRLAVLALQTGSDLGADAYTVANLDARRALVADLDSLADDFVTYAERHRGPTPATSDGMDVRAADTAGIDHDVHVAITEWLDLKLRPGSGMPIISEEPRAYFFLLKLGPLVLGLNPESLKFVWVRHRR